MANYNAIPPPPGPGRPKGSMDKKSILLKEAILKAAERAGNGKKNGEYKAGLVEYLTRQANSPNPAPFMALLGRVLLSNAIKDAAKAASEGGVNIRISGGLPSIGVKNMKEFVGDTANSSKVSTNPHLLAATIEADDELDEAPVIEGKIEDEN